MKICRQKSTWTRKERIKSKNSRIRNRNKEESWLNVHLGLLFNPKITIKSVKK